MAIKTKFSNKELAEIISNYNLGEYRNSEPISKGTVQTNYLLETTIGKYVFRYYENRSIGSVLFEADLISFLNSKSYPCPVIYKNQRGDYVGDYKEKPYAISKFIEGEFIVNPSDDQKKQLIQKVAELQNITKNFIPKNLNDRWNYSIELCKELAVKETERINTENANQKLKWIEEELSSLDLPETLPKGICHCDFHFSNVIFRDGEFKALIDFDDANYTYLTYDLATLINPFISSLTWNTWSKFKGEQNVFYFVETKKILLEYMKHRALSNNEKRHLFDVFKLSIMFDCIWYFERGDASGFYEKRKIDYLDRMGRERFYRELFETGIIAI